MQCRNYPQVCSRRTIQLIWTLLQATTSASHRRRLRAYRAATKDCAPRRVEQSHLLGKLAKTCQFRERQYMT
jgi:hypothetical protein